MLSPIPVQRISPPSVEEFYKSYVYASKPVVIMDMMKGWPALELWNHNYFAQKYGDVNVAVQRLRNGIVETNNSEGMKMKIMPLSECIDIIEKGTLNNGWLMSSPIDIFPASIKGDYRTPEYCANGRFLSSRLFISPGGMVSPLHQDMPENVYVMLRGTKRITLFEPSAPVYPYSRFSSLLNHSQTDIENPDYGRFPKLKLAQPYVVHLKEGETLFIPRFWWHHLRHEEPSISLNFWWSRGWMVPVAWAGTMYAKWRKIGNYSSTKD